ncbi:1983_t:CDS:2 [Diversispora eburnea]|uniref:1983_t:CDS:1 n=2 Tax=Diversisporales TaxID=214509 RepID=A0A9N8WPU7_9GLOM|nr:1983_t:CDS:2 [Diversispora eburnea]CAG8512415.1 7379_t:CDS:2 [Dentiscutata erythropus]
MNSAKFRNSTDPIAPHAERLINYMNTHPDTILGYAKYYGDSKDTQSARMTDIDSNGFIVMAKDANGKEAEVHIRFKNRLKSSEEVRPVLTEMAREAEEALNLPSTLPPNNNTTTRSSSTHTPFNHPHIAIYIGLLGFLYFHYLVIFHPSPPEFVEYVKSTIDPQFFVYILYVILVIHLFETTIVVIVLTLRGEKDILTWLLWITSTLAIGHFWFLWIPKKERKKIH